MVDTYNSTIKLCRYTNNTSINYLYVYSLIETYTTVLYDTYMYMIKLHLIL